MVAQPRENVRDRARHRCTPNTFPRLCPPLPCVSVPPPVQTGLLAIGRWRLFFFLGPRIWQRQRCLRREDAVGCWVPHHFLSLPAWADIWYTRDVSRHGFPFKPPCWNENTHIGVRGTAPRALLTAALFLFSAFLSPPHSLPPSIPPPWQIFSIVQWIIQVGCAQSVSDPNPCVTHVKELRKAQEHFAPT